MKTNTDTDTVVERSGLASDGSFTIAFNAKMAKILSDGLYSDKITSIIRELSCNAIDSHVEAGCPTRPIEVHLPTMFEPWFHVRDFGIGLDHAQVVGIYTVYGASTKTNSNDYIGQLGLGSKSPFSYVDAFDVSAIKDGVERQYSMYKNEQGMPSVALLGERETSEPNGVTVKMPARQEDFRQFVDKATRVFQWFEVRPTITGARGVEYQKMDIAYQGTGWKIRKRINHYYHSHNASEPVALMGRVAYPIAMGSLANLSSAQRAISGLPLIIDFGIGDLEIAASREALGYDDRTQVNIKSKLDLILTELAAEFEKQMTAAKTEWEARQLFGNIFGHNGSFSNEFVKAFGNHGLKWQGKVIKEPHITFATSDIWKDVKLQPALYTNNGRYQRVRQQTHHTSYTMRCNDRIQIIFDDLEKGGPSRVNYLIEETTNNQEFYLFQSSTDVTFDDMLKMMGNPPHKMASQLAKRPSAERTKIKMLEYRGFGDGIGAWNSVDRVLEDGGVYVLMDRWDVMRDGAVTTQLEDTVKMAIEIGILATDQKVYAPRGDLKKKVTDSPDWTDLWTLVSESITKKLTPSIMQNVSNSLHYTETAAGKDPGMWQTQWSLFDHKGPFGKFVVAMRTLESTHRTTHKHKLLIDLARSMGSSVALDKPTVDANALYLAVMATYPMLRYVVMDRYGSRGIPSNDVRQVQDYINTVDELNHRHQADKSVQLDPAMAQIINEPTI